MSLYSKFLKTEMTETDLYNLVLTDQRTHSGPYYMEQHGFVNRATLKEPMQPLLRNRQPTGPSNPDRKATCILSSNPSASLLMEALAITRVTMRS